MRALAWSVVLLATVGCGSQAPVCVPSSPGYSVTPSAAVADHDATAPGNQRQFFANSMAASGPGCTAPQVLQRLTAAWTVSDPLHIQISSAQDATNGLAICLGPTSGPATITARVQTGQVVTLLTATLFCE